MGWHITSGSEAGVWAATQIGCVFRPEYDTAIGLQRGGEFVAGVIYEGWNGKSIVAHIAVSGRMTPAFLAAIFDYPFRVCGAQKVICPVPSDNARSIKLATNMGFMQEARIQDAAPTGDVLLFTLTKSNCRFIEERYGKECTISPART